MVDFGIVTPCLSSPSVKDPYIINATQSMQYLEVRASESFTSELPFHTVSSQSSYDHLWDRSVFYTCTHIYKAIDADILSSKSLLVVEAYFFSEFSVNVTSYQANLSFGILCHYLRVTL